VYENAYVTENIINVLLTEPATYWWRVRAIDNVDRMGEWADSFRFTVSRWITVDEWTGGIESRTTIWNAVESWVIQTSSRQMEWKVAENWVSAIKTRSVEWRTTESWQGLAITRRVAWQITEWWQGIVQSRRVGWKLTESWSCVANVRTSWRNIDQWNVNVQPTLSLWRIAELWTNNIYSESVGWHFTESWYGTINSRHLEWRFTEDWSGSIKSRLAIWTESEIWTASTKIIVEWKVIKSWACNLKAPIPAPHLIEPENEKWIADNAPTFSWENLQAADNYWIQVDNDNDFLSPIIDNNLITENTWESTVELPLGWYYWRVMQFRSGENSGWSGVFKFQVVLFPPTSPVLVSPENDVEVPQQVTFRWINGTYATAHRVEIDNDDNWANGVVENIIVDMPENYCNVVLPYGTYHWRVWAYNVSFENKSENEWWISVVPIWRARMG